MVQLWRTEDPEVGEDLKIIKGGMWEFQRIWWSLNNFIKALVAGYGSGKTFIGCKRIIGVSLHNAPVPSLIISPSYKIAKRTIIPTMDALLDGKRSLYGPSFHWTYHKTDHEYKIRFKGREAIIWIASGDEPRSLKGPNIGAALIDEPFIQDREVLDQTLARVRHPRAKISEINLTGTPEELNWGYDITEGADADDYDCGVVHASTRQNLSLSPEYYQRNAQAMTDLAAQAYLDGLFVNLSLGRVYYGFSRKNVTDLPDPGGELFAGMDFNVDPMAAVIFWVQGKHMHIMDEIELPNADTYAMCDTFRNYTYGPGSGRDGECRITTVYPDASGKNRSTNAPSGQSDFTIITKEYGFNIDAPTANPPIRERENSVNGKLSPRVGPPTLTISPKCRRIIGYFEKYKSEKKNTTEHKAMSHLLDAAGYPVHRLFPAYRPQLGVGRLEGT